MFVRCRRCAEGGAHGRRKDRDAVRQTGDRPPDKSVHAVAPHAGRRRQLLPDGDRRRRQGDDAESAVRRRRQAGGRLDRLGLGASADGRRQRPHLLAVPARGAARRRRRRSVPAAARLPPGRPRRHRRPPVPVGHETLRAGQTHRVGPHLSGHPRVDDPRQRCPDLRVHGLLHHPTDDPSWPAHVFPHLLVSDLPSVLSAAADLQFRIPPRLLHTGSQGNALHRMAWIRHPKRQLETDPSHPTHVCPRSAIPLVRNFHSFPAVGVPFHIFNNGGASDAPVWRLSVYTNREEWRSTRRTIRRAILFADCYYLILMTYIVHFTYCIYFSTACIRAFAAIFADRDVDRFTYKHTAQASVFFYF